MNYFDRIQKVINYIGSNLDQKISLDILSEKSCISKFHFHRLFTAFTGLSLHQYVRWLRLKRAAHQLIVNKEESIVNTALNAGFDSHEAFSRAFKQVCGLTPNQFRQGNDWSFWESSPYCLPLEGEIEMNVTIKELNETRLAVIEHRGDPCLVANSVAKLISWAKEQPINLKPKAGDAFGFGYDDPATTPAKDFRFDLGLKVPENFKLDSAVIERHLPSGRYAVAMHKGTHDNISDTIYSIYREWLPNSNEELGDLPCVFCYHNFAHEVAETELRTEIWVLLK